MSMVSNFCCLHVKHTFSNRLYVGFNQTQSVLEKIVFCRKIERVGLGMTEYGICLGFILKLIGIAFKTYDEDRHLLFINKKSFCNLLVRIKQNNEKYNYFNPDYVERLYRNKKMNVTTAQKVYQIFNNVSSSFEGCNIANISIGMLSKF